jgi:CDP-glucose 4,6-dehydratase
VQDVVHELLGKWNAPHTKLKIEEDSSGAESQLLRLDCTKAHQHLGWKAVWTVPEALKAIAEWYRRYYENPGEDMCPMVVGQIEQFTRQAQEQGLSWALAPKRERST